MQGVCLDVLARGDDFPQLCSLPDDARIGLCICVGPSVLGQLSDVIEVGGALIKAFQGQPVSHRNHVERMPTFGQQADHPKNMTVIAEVEITFRHHVRKLFPTQVLTQQSAQNSLLRFQRIWGLAQRFA
ncbi:hypothetical protein D3C85_1128720 [compost metagenome]